MKTIFQKTRFKVIFAMLILLVSISASIGYKASVNTSEVTLESIEADAGILDKFTEYWNSNTYRCAEDQCSVSINLIIYCATYYGTYEKCLDGNKIAHCSSCKECDAY